MDKRILALWVATTLLFLICAVISFTVVSEDAYISYRYVENIADGYGQVFNQGGEVVEGYSNPTWVFLLVILHKLGLGTIVASRCLGLLFGSLVVLELINIFRLLTPGEYNRGALAAVAVVTAPSYIFWTQTGLENGLFLYLMTLGLRLALAEEIKPERFPYSAVAYFLLSITRPEGIMYFGIIGAWKIVGLTRPVHKKAFSRIILWAALTLIPLAIFLAWRYITFGEFVPNTFFAKVKNGFMWNLRVGGLHVLGFLSHTLWAPVIMPFVAFLISKFSRTGHQDAIAYTSLGRRFLQVLFIHTFLLVLFILYVGGDIHPYDRFGVAFLIFASIATFMLIPGKGKEKFWKNKTIWVCVIFVVFNLGYSFPPAYGITPPISRPPNFLAANLAGLLTGRMTVSDVIDRFMYPPVDVLEYVGRDMKAHPDIDGLVATEQCGKIPYYYEGPVLDLLGLNDEEIARIMHANTTWDKYAVEVLKHTPVAFVVVYTNKRFVSRYYIENMVMSVPFRDRYYLDAIYHFDYRFTDISGIEHSFPFEMVRYLPVSKEALVPLTDDEIRWFEEHQPVVDNPQALSAEVEAFRQANQDDPEKIINYVMELN